MYLPCIVQLFVVPFELYWSLCCYRLLGLIINLRLKSRLYCVQALRYTQPKPHPENTPQPPPAPSLAPKP